MNGDHIEYFQVCYMADKKFNEYLIITCFIKMYEKS